MRMRRTTVMWLSRLLIVGVVWCAVVGVFGLWLLTHLPLSHLRTSTSWFRRGRGCISSIWKHWYVICLCWIFEKSRSSLWDGTAVAVMIYVNTQFFSNQIEDWFMVRISRLLLCFSPIHHDLLWLLEARYCLRQLGISRLRYGPCGTMINFWAPEIEFFSQFLSWQLFRRRREANWPRFV